MVEDQNSIIFQQVLAMHNGFEFIEANNGEDAVRLAMRRDYDVILMDVMLPEMDGLTATRLIRERAPDVPIMLMSGNDYGPEAISAGATDFVLKPFDYRRLALDLTRLALDYRAKKARAKLTESQSGEMQIKMRRLWKLKEQAAATGTHTPPEILIEIEDLEAEIDRLTRFA